MSKSLEPITIIASEFCEDIGDSTEFHHARFMRKLLRAYRMLHLYISPELEVQSKVFPVSGQIELPCDFVYETKIGLLKNNCLVTLDLNKNLRLSNTKYTDTQIQTDINGYFDGSLSPDSFYPFYNVFRGDNYLGEMYGAGSGYHSNQWYNIKDGILEIGSLVPEDTEVVIEYKSNGLGDGFKLIPTEMIEAVTYKAKALFYEDGKPGLASQMEDRYRVEYQRLKRLYNTRPPEYLAFLFKSGDRPSHL